MTASSTLAAPRISVIIPAHNSAATLAGALDSLIRQTETEWEAIIVDDGSTDRTHALASGFAERDPRLRALRRDRGGVSAARNAGLSEARADWVLFLDADDRLDPSHLAHQLDAQTRHPQADVICGDWRLARPQGLGPVQPPIDLAEVFGVAARRPPFVIHAALTRRSRLQQCGGFDEGLASAEDWDLWQRIGRTGANFAPARTVARYSFRADSLSSDLALRLRSGLAVIERGHGPDPRVVDPAPAYAQGAPRQGLPHAKAIFGLGVAGAAIGAGQEHVLPEVLAVCGGGLLDPDEVATALVEGLARATEAEQGTWMSVWPTVAPRVESFLGQLEADQFAPRLTRRVLRRIELRLANSLWPDEHGVIGALQVVACDRSPRNDLRPARGAERVRLVVRERDGILGRLDLVSAETFERPQLNALIVGEFGGPATPARRPRPARRIRSLLAKASSLPTSAKIRQTVRARVLAERSRLAKRVLRAPATPADAEQPWVTLAYHRVADEGPAGLEDFRVSPERFAEHMRWLAEQGYVALSLEQLDAHVWSGAQLPRRAVLITFDDGYLDVLTQAAPAMERYGFVGTVFLVTEEMGGTARWDAAYGPPARLMDWAQAEALRARGWSFGAHSARHLPLTGLSPDELRRELTESREAIAGRLGTCSGLAYPYGDVDEAVAREAFAAGYRLAFTCVPSLWRRGSPIMMLPRLTALGGWSSDELAAAIGRLA
ncbi:glycosyltransferase [Phenylobacterium sp. LjRoot225]|uniref:glycosyltransferase n=1 Tax=Phenylobacterium sp. LjRoot225 TaxID=3342285 RepID=UPI003ED153AB